MLKAAFYQVEQCQEPPEEIRAEMQKFAADVGLGFHAFYMDSPKPWYLSEPSSVLRKMVEDAAKEAIALENSGEIGAYYEKRSIAPARCRGTIPRTASAVKCS